MTHHIDKIIDKYYAGGTTQEEESSLRIYLTSGKVSSEHAYMIPLFKHFESEKNMVYSFEPDLSFIKESEPKVRNMWPKLISIAASFIILFAVTFSWFNNTETMYKEKYTLLDTQEDQEEALAITLDALGFLGKKFDKGTKSLMHIQKYKKTDIFKSTK